MSLRRLARFDLPELLALQESATDGLPAHFLWPKTEGELAGFLDGALGAAYGVIERGELVAIALLRLPSEKHPLEGPPFPHVPKQDWPHGAGFLAHTIVAPRARGRGYQRALFDARLEHARRERLRWLCAGVQLDNVVSWRNLLAKGMAIAGVRFDTGHPLIGVLRALAAPEALATDPGDVRRVRADDASGHDAALRYGYLGVRLEADEVIYQRLR